MSSPHALLLLTLPWLGLGTVLGGCAPAERPRPITMVEVIAPDGSGSVLADPFGPHVPAAHAMPPPLGNPRFRNTYDPPAPVVEEESWFAVEASGPARQVLDTAEQMLADSVVVRGSCYGYISAIYQRAGFGDRRSRRAIFQGPRRGPYADLDLLQPGDWLFIVAYPDATPMGTHSVLFLGWEDRASGSARVVSYVGGQSNRPAHLMTRDVSRTYAIARAVVRQRPVSRR